MHSDVHSHALVNNLRSSKNTESGEGRAYKGPSFVNFDVQKLLFCSQVLINDFEFDVLPWFWWLWNQSAFQVVDSASQLENLTISGHARTLLSSWRATFILNTVMPYLLLGHQVLWKSSHHSLLQEALAFRQCIISNLSMCSTLLAICFLSKPETLKIKSLKGRNSATLATASLAAPAAWIWALKLVHLLVNILPPLYQQYLRLFFLVIFIVNFC